MLVNLLFSVFIANSSVDPKKVKPPTHGFIQNSKTINFIDKNEIDEDEI